MESDSSLSKAAASDHDSNWEQQQSGAEPSSSEQEESGAESEDWQQGRSVPRQCKRNAGGVRGRGSARTPAAAGGPSAQQALRAPSSNLLWCDSMVEWSRFLVARSL